MSMSKFSEGLRAAETLTSEVFDAVDPTKPREMGLGEIMLTGSTCAAIAILWYRRSTSSVRRSIRWDGDTLVPFEDEIRYRLIDILHYVVSGFVITGASALATYHLVPGIKEHQLWEPDGTGVSGLVIAIAGALSMFGVTWSMPFDASQGMRRKKNKAGKRIIHPTQLSMGGAMASVGPRPSARSRASAALMGSPLYGAIGRKNHDYNYFRSYGSSPTSGSPTTAGASSAMTSTSLLFATHDEDLLYHGANAGNVATQVMRRRALRWKQLAWTSACGLLGVGLSPFCRVSFADFFRASTCTAGVVGALSLAAMDSLIYVISPPFLSVCGFMVMGASIGMMVLPKSADPLDAMVHKGCEFAVAVFLCSSFLHNLQSLNAEASFSDRFDPINGAVVLYCHTIMCLLPILSANGDYTMWKRGSNSL